MRRLAAAVLLGCAISPTWADKPFSVGMDLVTPTILTKQGDLRFVATLAGTTTTVTTTPESALAARFKANLQNCGMVYGRVVESQIEMKTGDGAGTKKRITVKNFKLGGDMNALGIAYTVPAGELNNLRVGGTAYIEAEDIPGDYIGQATFRLVFL